LSYLGKRCGATPYYFTKSLGSFAAGIPVATRLRDRCSGRWAMPAY